MLITSLYASILAAGSLFVVDLVRIHHRRPFQQMKTAYLLPGTVLVVLVLFKLGLSNFAADPTQAIATLYCLAGGIVVMFWTYWIVKKVMQGRYRRREAALRKEWALERRKAALFAKWDAEVND